MPMTDYEWIDAGRRRERVLCQVLDKPRMPSEARKILGLTRTTKLTFTIRELLERGLILQKARGLYGLSERGQRVREKLLHEKGLHYKYTEPRLDWDTYVWVIVGCQRKGLLMVLERHPVVAAQLVRLAKRLHGVLSRTDGYKVLRKFVEKRLANAERHSRAVSYSVTRRGEAIKKQMLLAWLAFFVCL